MDALALTLSTIRVAAPLLATMRIGDNVRLDMAASVPAEICPFHYVSEGACVLESGGTATPLSAGDVVLLPRWPAYCLRTGTGEERITILEAVAADSLPLWSEREGLDTGLSLQIGAGRSTARLLGGLFTIEDRHASRILRDLPETIIFPATTLPVRALFDAAVAFLDGDSPGRPGYFATACRLLEVLIVESLRSWALRTRHSPGRLLGAVEPTISRALHAIHSRPDRRWTVGELAVVAGRSRSGFAATFKAVVGLSPHDYLREHRFQLAEAKLAGQQAIATIAQELGFGSAFAFSRAFRAARGPTPAQYRKRLRLESADAGTPGRA